MNFFKVNRIFNPPLKYLIIIYLSVVTVGMSAGLLYLFQETKMTPSGIIENYNGSEINEDFEIPEKYSKNFVMMLSITHTHVLGLAPIILSVCLIFFYVKEGKVSNFIILEPLISLIITFGSIWLIRFVDTSFVIITVCSGGLMYISIYYLVFHSIITLIRRNEI